MKNKKIKEKKIKEKKIKFVEERTNIRCRVCFMVDGYRRGESKCKHCGAKILLVDSV